MATVFRKFFFFFLALAWIGSAFLFLDPAAMAQDQLTADLAVELESIFLGDWGVYLHATITNNGPDGAEAVLEFWGPQFINFGSAPGFFCDFVEEKIICLDDVVNPGETRDLWVYYEPVPSHLWGLARVSPNAQEVLDEVDENDMAIIGSPTVIGLAATNSSPTSWGYSTFLTASIEAGVNVTYVWDFGDGGTGNGESVWHLYEEPGIYTATVTASNPIGSATAQTVLSITSAKLEAALDWPTMTVGQVVTATAVFTNVGDGPTLGPDSPISLFVEYDESMVDLVGLDCTDEMGVGGVGGTQGWVRCNWLRVFKPGEGQTANFVFMAMNPGKFNAGITMGGMDSPNPPVHYFTEPVLVLAPPPPPQLIFLPLVTRGGPGFETIPSPTSRPED